MTKILNRIGAILLIAMTQNGCSEFLELKPDKKLVVATTGENLLAVMDNVASMNYNFSAGLTEMASDNLFLPVENWKAITLEEYRNPYIWAPEPVTQVYWNAIYRKILACNVVIDQIDDVTHKSERARNELLGIAKFFRAYAFFDLAQVFSVTYQGMDANSRLGVVLRLSSDVNIVSKRSTLEQTYQQIIADYKEAVRLMKDISPPLYPTRPTRAAAYGGLARTYLAMQEYEMAGVYADSCLQLNSELLDYATISNERPYPFDRFNKEVVFFSQMVGSGLLLENVARVDTLLYTSYAENDYRKTRFFSEANDGFQSFTGDYGQNTGAPKFNGITTAEMVLIRAESSARKDIIEAAAKDLVSLLNNRMALTPEEIQHVMVLNKDDLLNTILLERRKELVFRGLRWTDIRRLNSEGTKSITLTRGLGDETYLLPSESVPTYAFKIPTEVIDLSEIVQN